MCVCVCVEAIEKWCNGYGDVLITVYYHVKNDSNSMCLGDMLYAVIASYSLMSL